MGSADWRVSAQPQPVASSSHPQLVGARRVESVVFSGYEIQAGFSSPYPFDDSLASNTAPSASTSALAREGHGRFSSKSNGAGGAGGGRSNKAGQAAKRAARRESAAAAASAVAARPGVDPPLLSPELELAQLEASVASPELGLGLALLDAPAPPLERTSIDGLPSPSLAPAALPPAPPLTAAQLAKPHAVLAPIVFTVPASHSNPHSHPSSRRPSASLSPIIGSASLASAPGAKPFVDIVRTTTHPRAPSARSSPSLTPATIPTPLPIPVPPLSLVPDVTVIADAEAEAARGHGGRFLPKPEGESIKARRRLAKAARDEQAQANPPGVRHVTVREQRERDKAAREAREKANGGPPDPLEHLITKRLFVCHGCFKYMVHERAYVAHEVRWQSLFGLQHCADVPPHWIRRRSASSSIHRDARSTNEARTRSGRSTARAQRWVSSILTVLAATDISPSVSSTARTCASSASSSSSTSTCSST